MSLRVEAAPREAAAWLEARAGWRYSDGVKLIQAVDGDGAIKGMVAFDYWTPNAVQGSVVLDAPIAARRLLKPAFDYVFNQCDRRVLIAMVAANNTRSRYLMRHLGFLEAHRIKDGWKVGCDVIVYEMRREECRYLQRKAAES